jgi:multidrug efflux pump subunit AcrA (membrane-fusion protein)
MQKLLIGICILVIGAVTGAGVLWVSVRDRLAAAPTDPPGGEQEAQAQPGLPRLSHTPEGETVVRFETEIQQRVGLKTEPLVAATRQPEIAAYGLLQPDPAQSFTLRAPVAGTLRADETANWPGLNQHVDAGVLVGYIEPRLTQTERIDLATRLTQARADAAEAEAALTAAQSSYDGKAKLNAANKAVSDRALEEARAKVQAEEARLNAARQIVRLIESANSTAGDPAARFELRTDQAGEVVEIAARPGEAVESGQVLLRIVRFDTLVARVEVPVGELFDETATSARIVPVGDEERSLSGAAIGRGYDTNSATHGPTLLFRVRTAGLPLRPGAAVVAHVPAPGGLRTGVVIPRGAVVRLLGKAWVYVQTAEESFTRRELSAAEPMDGAWFCTRGFQPGDRVVTDGAQVLLSEELKSQIEREEAATK